MGGWVDEWMNEWMYRWMNGWMNGWMKNEWMDGWKKERVNEWREGERKRERTKVILEKAEKEGIRRISVFLEEPLSDQNKINAINTFAPSILTFLMPVLYFSHKDLNEVELKIKFILTKKWARHPQHLNTLLYASRLQLVAAGSGNWQTSTKPRSSLLCESPHPNTRNVRPLRNSNKLMRLKIEDRCLKILRNALWTWGWS